MTRCNSGVDGKVRMKEGTFLLGCVCALAPKAIGFRGFLFPEEEKPRITRIARIDFKNERDQNFFQ